MKKTSIVAFLAFSLLPRPGAALDMFLTRSQRAQKLVEEGQRQILQGNFARAIDSCTQALGIREDWGPAYLCRSEARLLSKNAAAANNDARKAGTLDPKSGEPLRILGLLAYQGGRYAAAVEYFSEALHRTKIKPESVSDIYYYRAYSHFNLGNYRQALHDVDEGLGVMRGINGDYSDWSFYALRAEIDRNLGDEVRAEADERKVISLIDQRIRTHPAETADLLRRRAESNTFLRDYQATVQDFDRLLALDRENMQALTEQANAYSLLGKHKEAVANLSRVLRADSGHLEALRMRAMERFTLGDSEGSLSDLNAALALHPDDGPSLSARGILKRYLADYRGSLRDLDRAQALNPEDSSLWGHKAFVLEMLQEHKAAMNLAQKTLKDDPEDASAIIALGLAASALNRCDVALPSLDRLVKQSPDSGHFFWLRGECRCKTKQFQGCFDDLKTAQSLDPGSAFLSQRLAEIHRKYLDLFPMKATVEELRQSIAYFDRAAALKALGESQRLGRAESLLQLADKLRGPKGAKERARLLAEASRDCRAVLGKSPRNKKARQLLKKSHP